MRDHNLQITIFLLSYLSSSIFYVNHFKFYVLLTDLVQQLTRNGKMNGMNEQIFTNLFSNCRVPRIKSYLCSNLFLTWLVNFHLFVYRFHPSICFFPLSTTLSCRWQYRLTLRINRWIWCTITLSVKALPDQPI